MIGLKVIDGTPTEMSKYLREKMTKERFKQLICKKCRGRIFIKNKCVKCGFDNTKYHEKVKKDFLKKEKLQYNPKLTTTENFKLAFRKGRTEVIEKVDKHFKAFRNYKLNRDEWEVIKLKKLKEVLK